MATKPSIIPTWNTGGANNTAPTGPKIVLGFTNGERAASSYFNNRMKLYGEWCQYLSDGALTGAHTFGSTVGVTGAVTCSSTLGVTGAVVMSSTLAVTGAITATGGLTSGAATVDLSAATSLRLPSRKRAIDASAGGVSIGAAGFGGYWTYTTTPTTVEIPINLDEGDRITGVKIYYGRNSGTTVGFELISRDLAGVNTVLANRVISSGTGNASTDFTTVTSGSVPQTLAANKTYALTFAGGNTDRLYGVIVTWDRPT